MGAWRSRLITSLWILAEIRRVKAGRSSDPVISDPNTVQAQIIHIICIYINILGTHTDIDIDIVCAHVCLQCNAMQCNTMQHHVM